MSAANEETTARLEYLRGELRGERISYGDLIELQNLADQIDPGDVELLEAAGVPEFPDDIDVDDERGDTPTWDGRLDDGPRFGCEECDHTGYHQPYPDEIGNRSIEVEMHDECSPFETDYEAAQALAWAHPVYRWLVYRIDGGGLAVVNLHEPYPDPLPVVAFAEPLIAVTDAHLPVILAAMGRGGDA